MMLGRDKTTQAIFRDSLQVRCAESHYDTSRYC